MNQRVAIVSDSFPPNWGGGVTSAHFQLYWVLKKRGFQVKAFCYFDKFVTGSEDDVVRCITPYPLVWFLRRANNLVFRLVDPGKVAYQMADILIRAWGAWRLNGELARFAPDVIVFPDHGSPALWVRPISGCRRVLIAHHNPGRFLDLPLAEPFSARDVRMAASVENRVLRSIDKVICPSVYMKGVFSETYQFEGPVEVIPNIVDEAFLDGVSPADPRPLLDLPDDAPLIYVPAGGNKFKGSGMVCDLISRLAEGWDEPFGVYISGALGNSLREQLNGLGEKVRLYAPGPLEGPANLAVVNSCSFTLYPTMVENYSMALLESALCGVPVVTFDVGGNREIVIDGETGFLVPLSDMEGLAKAARRLMYRETLVQMSKQTRADAERRLAAQVVAGRWVDSLSQFPAD